MIHLLSLSMLKFASIWYLTNSLYIFLILEIKKIRPLGYSLIKDRGLISLIIFSIMRNCQLTCAHLFYPSIITCNWCKCWTLFHEIVQVREDMLFSMAQFNSSLTSFKEWQTKINWKISFPNQYMFHSLYE